MAPLPVTKLTEEEYFRLERVALERSEFYDGEIFAMAGGSFNHSALASRLIEMIGPQRPHGCRTFTSDLKIKIPSAGLVTYSDGGLLCGDPQFANDEKEAIVNPLLLMEVLSPSSADYDRGKKFEFYRTLDSLREYLIVHQDRRHIEYHSKQADGSWTLRDLHDRDELFIESLNLRISLADLYSVVIDPAPRS